MAELKINYYSTGKKVYFLPPHHAPSLLLGIAVSAVIILIQGSLPYTNCIVVTGIEIFSNLTESTKFFRKLITTKF